MISLDYFAPPDDLRPFFGAQYRFYCGDAQVANHTRADFAQIRLMLAGEGHYGFAGERSAITPEACLIGPTSMATTFQVDGPLSVVGVSVLPLGWAALGLGDASSVADDVRDLAALGGPEWLNLLARLRHMEDAAAAVEQFWSFLRARLRPVSAADRFFVEAADQWLEDRRSPNIAALQAATGLGARQVARLCNRLYGAPPKQLARKYRALRCALELAREDRPWAELAGDDFYDQSHFIRELRHFTGLTPTDLREQDNLVLRLSLQRAELAGDLSPLSRMS
jgi:AraC-like DNA-binding protein